MTGSWRSPQDALWLINDPAARYDPLVALVVVDVQNDFADSRGSLFVRGGSEIVPLVNAEIGLALAAGAAVVYTGDWHPAHTPHFAQDGGIWPVHCVQNTWGAELHPDLSVSGPFGEWKTYLQVQGWVVLLTSYRDSLIEAPFELV